MSEHFSLAEYTRSAKAAEMGIGNIIPASLVPAAMQTLQMLEGIRAFLCSAAGHEVPMLLNSGFRSPALNAAVGSSKTSDHLLASAADWHAPAFGPPNLLCRALAPHVELLGIGQLIYECRGGAEWVHTSWRMPSKMINRILTIRGADTLVGIVET